MGMFAGSGTGCSTTTAEMGDPRFWGMGEKGLCQDSLPLLLPPTFYLLLQAIVMLITVSVSPGWE